MSEDEQKKQQQAEDIAAMQKELNELRRDKTVSQYTAKFIAQGYDEKLAADTAKAMADGNTDKVFANQQVFLETYAKQVKASAMQGTPKPASGSGSNGADFSKKAADAHEVVTDGMTINEVVEKILDFCSHAKAHERSRRELI